MNVISSTVKRKGKAQNSVRHTRVLYLVRSKPPVLALSASLPSFELSASNEGTGTGTRTGIEMADDIAIFPLGDRGVSGAGRGEVRR